mgnify:CR=1 FL=1|tara:strand:- start:47 stop:2545 length:2499 start_codon:yes stop_codon:yes gene_type:complete
MPYKQKFFLLIMNITLYSISNYSQCSNHFIQNNAEIFHNIDFIQTLDKSYHFRIFSTQKKYIFFGDLDHFSLNIQIFIQDLKSFLSSKYRIHFEEQDFKYTKNDSYNEGESYHFSIPTLHTDIPTLKSIMKDFISMVPAVGTQRSKYEKVLDTSVYKNGWFRCPYQSKPSRKLSKSGKHIIVKGTINDFIIDYIPSIHHHSNFIPAQNIDSFQKKDTQDYQKEEKSINIYTKKIYEPWEQQQKILSSIINKPMIYKNIFDNCYSQERFEKYEYWMSVGMGLKNIFSQASEETAFQLFDYFSSKSHKYKGTDDVKNCFDKFKFLPAPGESGYTASTLYYYAKQDNKNKFIEIMNENRFELGPTDICKFIKTFAGNKFIYSKNFKLFCFNGKFWEQNNIEFRKYISGELYNFLKLVLVECFWNNREFNSLKSKLEKFKTISLKKELEETYKEYGLNETIKFDDKWFLFGFNNTVYDLQEQQFREYSYDDYVATTCGYDWREPTQEELNTVHSLIQTIIPDQEERETYLQILSTTLEGKCLEKFIVFNGVGRNGKGLMDDLLLLALGNYAMIGNNSILFENNKTGANPEKANMHKKRLVLFREPPAHKKFSNSQIKELTGGGQFSARGLHESETCKQLNLTMIVECNQRPLFEEEPQNAEKKRIIDVFFRSTFVEDENEVNIEQNVYQANEYYKHIEFQEKHKYALLKILFDKHKDFHKNKKLFICDSIKKRTENYLEMSCNIISWFKDNYEKTSDDHYFLKLSDLFSLFKQSDYYIPLISSQKRKYNLSYFKNYFITDKYLKKFYYDRKKPKNESKQIRDILIGWRKKNDDDYE